MMMMMILTNSRRKQNNVYMERDIAIRVQILDEAISIYSIWKGMNQFILSMLWLIDLFKR